MSFVILIRNPSNDRVIAVTTDGDNIATYETEDEAEKEAHRVPVCKAWPYVVVEAP